ncbi:MAG: hypothetical protein WCW68_01550 [Methanothrix sp.]|jgi:hypothetical protein
MAEVITIEQLTDAAPNYNEVTAIRFCTSDEHAPGLLTPCKVPPTGVAAYYSFWITLCLNYSGDFSLINNLRFWGPGNIADTWFSGSKGRMVAGRLDSSSGGHGFLVASYQQSAGTSGLTGYSIKDATNGHAVYKGQTISVIDVDTLSEASPLVVDTRDIVAAGRSKCLLLQTECYPGAGHDEMSPVTLVFAVDVV